MLECPLQVVKAFVVLSVSAQQKTTTQQAEEELGAELQGFAKGITAPYKYPRLVSFFYLFNIIDRFELSSHYISY